MFVYSRTATRDDYTRLHLDKLIMEYAGVPKPDFTNANPRYKFWDYALTLKVAKEIKAKTILDVGNGSDLTYQIICDFRGLELKQIMTSNLAKFPVRPNKFDMVTAFGILEHFKNYAPFLEKLFKHVEFDGVLVLTTDSESTKKNRIKIITPDDLVSISFMAEEYGFEFYPENHDRSFEYLQSDRIELMSLVLKRVGT